MADKNRWEEVMQSFETLKQNMKTANVAALEAEDFGRSRELATLMEELVKLQRKATKVLGTDAKQATEGTKEYPHFFRRGETLVKEGLRRDGVSTYEQKTPQETYGTVLSTLRELKKTQDEFHASDVINRVKCPDYHVYSILNLLIETGHLETPQRGLYRFLQRRESPWAEGVWDSVPQEAKPG